MTFRQFVLKYLTDRGMFDRDAATVAESYIAESDAAMDGRWNDCVEDYPEVMQAVVALGLNRHAIMWIDANKPLAWFRPMFVVEPEAA